jgi:hypothetical protein
MRRIQFDITPEALLTVVGVPGNVNLVDVSFDSRFCVVHFVLESDDFATNAEGTELPKVTIRLNPDRSIATRIFDAIKRMFNYD